MANLYYELYPTLLTIVFIFAIIRGVVLARREAKAYEKQLNEPVYTSQIIKVPAEHDPMSTIDGSPKI